jgi:uncharacterized protein YgiM (DUF1202 family)
MSAALSARHLFTVAIAVAVSSALPALPSYAQDASGTTAAPVVENSKYNFSGTINANAVNVRSGPSDNFYATTKLDQGVKVTVVGIKFDWLKILPPEGSYSYIAKAYVMKTTVQMKLDKGAEVKIVGEKDEYWKIAPLPLTYMYVKKDFVTPGDPLPTANVEAMAAEAAKASSKVMETPQAIEPTKPVAPDALAASPTTAPTTAPAADAGAVPSTQPLVETPSTQPVKVSVTDEFDNLEAEFQAFSKDKIEEQPLADALTRYEALVANPELPASMKRIADVRVTTIKTRIEVRDQFLAVQETQKQMDERRTALRAEKQELEERIEKTKVKVYAAVGTLRTSSLQAGPKVLYRLTDPSSGRTLVYVRTDDAKYAAMIGQFVAIDGPVTDDSALNLKFITPTETTPIETSAVGKNVTAQIVPPSILESLGTATINGQ